MKRFFLLLIWVSLVLGATAQNISAYDGAASSLNGKRIDQNGEVAALIKVVTTETGFIFEGGRLGIVDTKQEAGEIWVWVPRASRKITIKHPQLGVLRDYMFPVEIEAERTYEMVLTTDVIETHVKKTIRQQYLTFQITPPNATLEVNDQIWELDADGVAQKYVEFGTYSYRVQTLNYHPDAGKVTVDDPNNTKFVTVTLQPNFGWIEVPGTGNLNDASVYVDNILIGKAPCKSEALKSGPHSVRVVKKMYNTYSGTVTVNDNETTRVAPELGADYADVTLKVDGDADAEIWVNDERKGIGTWTGQLGRGIYKVECKRPNYETSLLSTEITPEMNGQSITLPAPRPIYGSLMLESTPRICQLFIDGQEVGTTPKSINEILIGPHVIKLTKEGYNDFVETVTISKDERKQMKVTMDNVDYNELAKKGDDYFDAKNYEEALKCYREAAEHGNAVGQNGMGRLYDGGYGVPQDYAESVKWYRLAAEQGLDRSQNNLGWCYVHGTGVEKDYAQAERYFRLSAEQGFKYAQYGLGSLYYQGAGVPQDYEKALEWYRLSAEQGYANSQHFIGLMYYYGSGVTQDYEEAAKWFRKAADQGAANSQSSLGILYYKGLGVKQDYQEAAKWFRKAAEQGRALAQHNLGSLYNSGNGVEQNYDEAVKWYRKAAEQGEPNGQVSLGYMYEKGHGVKQDYKEAVKWYQKAAEQGNATAQWNMGTMYENGNGVRKSLSEAKKWYQKAADQGDERAKTRLKELE